MKDPLTFRVKRPKKPKKKPVYSKENNIDCHIVYIVRKIKTGDFDPAIRNHKICADIAREHGVIDKDYNILKEEYLLCRTKRK